MAKHIIIRFGRREGGGVNVPSSVTTHWKRYSKKKKKKKKKGLKEGRKCDLVLFDVRFQLFVQYRSV
jgi:hypothetical protein